LNGSYKILDSEQDILVHPTDEDIYSFRSVLTWRTGKNIWLKAAYRYQKTKNNESHATYNRNTIWLGFMVGHDVLALF
jgi:hypothetical protein